MIAFIQAQMIRIHDVSDLLLKPQSVNFGSLDMLLLFTSDV